MNSICQVAQPQSYLRVKPGLKTDPGVPLRFYFCKGTDASSVGQVNKPEPLKVSSNMQIGGQSSFSRDWIGLEQGHWMTDIQLHTPGLWTMSHPQTAPLQVEIFDTKPLGFAEEFGIFSAVVVLLLGGMLLWLKSRKNKSESNAIRA